MRSGTIQAHHFLSPETKARSHQIKYQRQYKLMDPTAHFKEESILSNRSHPVSA